jgi:hypothetical protein
MQLMTTIVDLLIGCRHRNTTRPITPVHKVGTPAEETYVACLACGQRLSYDLENMRIGKAIPVASKSPAQNSFQVS